MVERDEPMLVVDPQPAAMKGTVACAGETAQLIAALERQFGVKAVPLSPKLGKVPTILLAIQGGAPEGWLTSDTDAPVANTDDPELYKHQMWGKAGAIHTWRGLAPGKVTVKVFLADGYSSAAGAAGFRSRVERHRPLRRTWTSSPKRAARTARSWKPSRSMRPRERFPFRSRA